MMGPVIPSRGIRQGDPLSPYLFIICAEGLSALIRKYEAKQWIHGVKICRKAPVVSHMLFEDDSYVFCKATTDEGKKVLEMLDSYEKASGQKVNSSKSSVFFSTNVIQYNREMICQSLLMKEADEISKYLRLPNMLGRNKAVVLGFLKDKVTSRIQSWRNKKFSKPSKEILIKSEVQYLPTFAMSVFLLPLEITKDIERSLSSYWWGDSKNNSKKIHWMSWDRLCKHKSAGGLRFRNFREFNLAMLGKRAWRLITRPESLVAKMYEARYFADGNFLDSKLGQNPSFIWRSIWGSKDLHMSGIRWRVGSGAIINITGQPWLSDEDDPFISSELQVLKENKMY